jgi:cytochrome c-type biogenesis protein CcmF
MASLGSFLLLATFVVCSYAAVVSVVGARRGSRALIESGIGAFYLITALMTVGSAVMINAFITDDFTIKYVTHYSDSVQPLFYKITAYWGGLDGSVMFWVFLLSIFGAIAVYVNRERHRELIPYVVAVIATVEAFFLYLMIVHNNPFTTYLAGAPPDGDGLNPVLQNYWMVIHPPSLYTGFVGMTIPFAFCMAALITGHLDDAWLRAVRRWTMFAWLFLTFGLTLGMIWAYEEIGWGGFWNWDPVENAGLLPWFTATAFLHSVMVQERRSMLRVWNVTLVIVTFFLTIFGTFMTRSGVVESVHAFGKDPELAQLFTIFMAVILIVSFSFVIYRLPLLRARNELESWMSREAAFMVNNWILLFCAFFVLFATMFPTLSEAINGDRLTVATPFYNRWMTPIGLVLLFLTGVGPLLGWRKSTLRNVRDQFMWPTIAAAVTAAALLAVRFHSVIAALCFVLCAFVLGTVTQEFWRGTNVRRKSTGTDFFTALVGLVGRNKRRYGGYIVHIGVVLFMLGCAGQAYKQEKEAILTPGKQETLGSYTVRYDSLKVSADSQKQIITANVTVFEDGQEVRRMAAEKWHFNKRGAEPPTTEVGIWRRAGEDFYVVLAAYEVGSQTAHLKVVINPLVNWVWFGFGVLALGTMIALLPEKVYSFAVEKVPAGAATATMLVLALALGGATLRAQEPATEQEHGAQRQHAAKSTLAAIAPRNEIEKRLGERLVCLCGDCGKEPIGVCTCSYAAGIRRQIAELVDQGKSEDEIIQHFIAKYGGQQLLGEPLNQGFNRLAWLFPYLAGATGIVVVGAVAMRWSRRRDQSGPETQAPASDALNERLDDELRNLD